MTKVIETHPEVEELIKTFKKETVAEAALNYLQSKHEDEWICGSYEELHKSCAFGWIKRERPELLKIDRDVIRFTKYCIETVNDGEHPFYRQPTAKQRVIALLQDMIKAGY